MSHATQTRGGADTVVSAYDRYAPLYDRLYGAVLEPGRRALAREAARVAEGSRRSLLEVGVGTGLTLPLYPAGIEVTGVDISDSMLERARQRARELPERSIALHHMNGERLDFPDGSFDCVTLPYVLSVTPDPAGLVREVRRVCRRDGTIFVLNHFSGSRFWWLFERMVRPLADRIGFRSDFDFEEHVLRHDWKVLSVQEVNLMGLSKLVTLRNA